MTRKKAGITLYNPHTTPVVFDAEGRIVDGGGRREVERLDEVGEEAVGSGLLVRDEQEQEQASADPEVKTVARVRDKESGASVADKPA